MQPAQPEAPPRAAWLVSPGFDLGLIAVPLLLSGLFLLLPPQPDVPLWAFLFLVVAFDVAHVWATLYLGPLDPEVRRRRPWLLLLPLPVAWLIAFRLHLHDPTLYWTVLAYVAIHHFAAQQWGFVALYRALAGQRDPVDRHLDRWATWTGALGPVLLWHADPERQMDWFKHGERFLFQLDPSLRGDILTAMAAIGGLWLARQVQHLLRGTFVPGKAAWVIATWVSWSGGLLLSSNPLLSLAAINLLHGLPFLALVWVRLERGRPQGGRSLLDRLRGPGRVWAFYGLLLLLAVGEEGLWDGLHWGTYLPALTGWPKPDLPAGATSALVALLALPQTVHYYLDAWLWKLDGSNPDLHLALGLPHKGGAPAPLTAPATLAP